METPMNMSLTPSRIIHYIMHEPDGYEYTYVILGKEGPTGKTWISEGLKQLGYRTIELSEYIFDFMDYTSDRNYFRIIEESKCVVIILNEKLK